MLPSAPVVTVVLTPLPVTLNLNPEITPSSDVFTILALPRFKTLLKVTVAVLPVSIVTVCDSGVTYLSGTLISVTLYFSPATRFGTLIVPSAPVVTSQPCHVPVTFSM